MKIALKIDEKMKFFFEKKRKIIQGSFSDAERARKKFLECKMLLEEDLLTGKSY
jgi:hypothetical protein